MGYNNLIIYAGVLRYIKQILFQLKREIDINAILAGDFIFSIGQINRKSTNNHQT